MTDYPFSPQKLAHYVDYGKGAQWKWELTCPICKHNFEHIEDVRLERGRDNFEASWEGRGDLATISFWCEECMYIWALCFGFHKGNTMVFFRSVGKKVFTP